MAPSRFDALSEQLLRAGIAPRHVGRYVGELNDHFDDLVREETANGASLRAAKDRARERLGDDNDLAAVMLARPELQSLVARYPAAVFGLGPFVAVLAAIVLGVAIEAGIITLAHVLVPRPSAALRESFVSVLGVWNALNIAPLAVAIGLCAVGLRQRVPALWIVVGVACACLLGAFQQLSFTDNGHHGELSLAFGLLPPYPMTAIVNGLYRIAAMAVLGGAYWFAVHRRGSGQSGTVNRVPEPLPCRDTINCP